MAPQSSHGRGAAPVQQQQNLKQSTFRATAGRLAALLLLVCSFALLGASSAFAITRSDVLARAQTWIDTPVAYSQAKYFGGYRTDCSGYVSMCWQTGTSWNTRTFASVTRAIPVDQLQPGDAMLRVGYHVRLFYGWVDAERTRYVTYEQTSPTTKSSIKYIADDLAAGYVPCRYNAIEGSPPLAEALSNGSFNVWASGVPVWWWSGGNGHETVVDQRSDIAKAGRFSLELVNSTKYTDRYVSLQQTASIDPDARYTLSAWARTAGDPRSLEMRLRYLDAAGGSLLETSTTGAAWGVDDTGFKQMSVPVGTPPGAVKAVVTLRLAGAPAVDASGTPGNSAVLDEISLSRPHTTISIKANATATKIGRIPILSGSVTPGTTIGKNTAVYVKKPGKRYWTYSSNRTVYSLGGSAAWQYKYYFKRGMTKGVYYFKAVAPEMPGALGSTSSLISIRLK
jgi:hypothetical protein